jgi:peptidoglycan/xylan/chitin deacetylase (PgdA/CDA1 family)
MKHATCIVHGFLQIIAAVIILFPSGSCHIGPANAKQHTTDASAQPDADRATKKEVPVLCYHQVRPWAATDSRSARTFIIPPDRFAAHMKMLHDSGYHTILPDELLAYAKGKATLPSRPVLLSFDDGTVSQFTTALPVMEQYGFKAVFFIMTVTLNRAGYMTEDQIRTLAMKGHVIGAHTWDHHDVRKYTGDDWKIQLEQPRQKLERITGKEVSYFAYPFGAWNETAVGQLQRCAYRAAFQLSSRSMSVNAQYTIRRIVADGHWSSGRLQAALERMQSE